MRVLGYIPKRIEPDVQEVSAESYATGLRCFIEPFLAGRKGRVALYQFGELRTPGVSDIDLLIVAADAYWKPSVEKAKAILGGSETLSYLFTHEPVTVSESLLPHLTWLHTLENCRFLAGDWDPLKEQPCEPLDDNSALIRHAVWNSFMRIAGLDMGADAIGLRRALTLMHNMLASAHAGNRFLAEPVATSLQTNAIRREILATSRPEQGALCREYMQEVVSLLNAVDTRLDMEILGPPEQKENGHVCVIVSRNRFLVSPLSFSRRFGNPLHDFLLWKAVVVKVPAYLFHLTAVLARDSEAVFPRLAPFREVPVPESAWERFGAARIAEHYVQALEVFRRNEMPLLPTIPFAHDNPPLPRSRQRIQNVQQRLLTRWGVGTQRPT